VKTKTTWAALAAGLTLGLALGHATKPVEAARQPKGVLSPLLGKFVDIDTPTVGYSGTLEAFDDQWVAVRTGQGIAYCRIGRIETLDQTP
jgi:hypothetical protein